MSKLAKFLISDLEEDWSKPSIKFFRSSGAYGYIIWLTIVDAYFEKREIAIETLVSEVKKYASRRTILDFIQKGVEAKFINKIDSTQDKRKNFIKPSESTVQEYNEWSREFKKNII
jgi:hypothetical protein